MKPPQSRWPDPLQELLLQACLGSGHVAKMAWEQWVERVDIHQIDPSSYRLVPLLYHNLKLMGIEHPLLSKLKGIYRHNWYQNHMFLNQFKHLLRSLREKDIPVLLLKGLALALKYYKDLGLRHMSDFDVLVPRNRASEVRRALLQQGWKSEFDEPEDQLMRRRHSEGFKLRDLTGRNIDLHWHALGGRLREKDDRLFWKGSMPLDVDGISIRVLNPADEILHVCAHAFHGRVNQPVRWLADVHYVLRTVSGDLDWNRLIHQARRKEIILPMRETLLYLREKFSAPVPSRIIDRLRSIRIPAKQYLTFVPYYPYRETLSLTLYSDWRKFSDKHKNKNGWSQLLLFPVYMKERWKLKTLWSVPVHIAGKIMTGSVGIGRYRITPAFAPGLKAHVTRFERPLVCVEKYHRSERIMRIPSSVLREVQVYLRPKRRTVPDKKFLIFAQGRSGSTLLQRMLNQHPRIHADGEIFYDPVLSHEKYLHRSLMSSKRPVYGFKLKIYQLTEIQRIRNVKDFLFRLHCDGWKIIHLRRQNLFRQAISNQVATHYGRFYLIKGRRNKIKQHKMAIDGKWLIHEIQQREYFGREEEKALEGIGCHHITYEQDLLRSEDHQNTLDRMFAFLDVERCSVMSDLIRMVPDRLSDSITNIDKIKKMVYAAGYGKYWQDENYDESLLISEGSLGDREGVKLQ